MSEEERPYRVKEVIKYVRQYNPNYGDHRICCCSHPYHRHFDFYEQEELKDAGCKYCCCNTFEEDPDSNGCIK